LIQPDDNPAFLDVYDRGIVNPPTVIQAGALSGIEVNGSDSLVLVAFPGTITQTVTGTGTGLITLGGIYSNFPIGYSGFALVRDVGTGASSSLILRGVAFISTEDYKVTATEAATLTLDGSTIEYRNVGAVTDLLRVSTFTYRVTYGYYDMEPG